MQIAEYIENARLLLTVIGDDIPAPHDATVQLGADIRMQMDDPSFEICADAARRTMAERWLKSGAVGLPHETVAETIKEIGRGPEPVVAIEWRVADG